MSLFVRDRPIFDVFPSLHLPMVSLGDWPTPLEVSGSLPKARGMSTVAYLKRDDLSSPIYGGNKVRVLEALFAQAIEEGARHIDSMGAFGTNHGVATLLHAPRVGLSAGNVVFPQPQSACAAENFEQLAASEETLRIPHWSFLPLAAAARRIRRHSMTPFMMPPGGATPRGALAYISGALELAFQLRAQKLRPPRAIVVGLGSTCTSAGLLAGLHIAKRFSLMDRIPRLVAVRVTPWPVTSRYRVTRLAEAASRLLAENTGDPRAFVNAKELGRTLEIDGSELGAGYGHPTPSGIAAIDAFQKHAGFTLDTTYSGKSGAAFLRRLDGPGPVLFWSTKSTAPLPDAGPILASRDARWLARATESIASRRQS